MASNTELQLYITCGIDAWNMEDRRPYSTFQYLEGILQESPCLERDLLQGHVATGQGGDGFKVEENRLSSGLGRKYFL